MSLGGLLWRSARSAWWTSRRTGRGAFGFHRLIANQGTEVGMQEFFEKLVLGGCPLVELSAAGRGLIRRHDRLVAILAAADPEAPDGPTLARLLEAMLAPDLLRGR